jgi:hypothetical protein
LGYRILKSEKGKVYATKPSKLFLQYAFDVLKINEIKARTSKDNYVWKYIIISLGFKYLGSNSNKYVSHEECFVITSPEVILSKYNFSLSYLKLWDEYSVRNIHSNADVRRYITSNTLDDQKSKEEFSKYLECNLKGDHIISIKLEVIFIGLAAIYKSDANWEVGYQILP